MPFKYGGFNEKPLVPGEFVIEKIHNENSRKPAREYFLDNIENQIKLAQKLNDVYTERPNMDDFVGLYDNIQDPKIWYEEDQANNEHFLNLGDFSNDIEPLKAHNEDERQSETWYNEKLAYKADHLNLNDFANGEKQINHLLKERYTEWQIAKDKETVENLFSGIALSNASVGSKVLKEREAKYQRSEIVSVMVIQLLNRWFKNCKTIMTTEFDDKINKIDAVLKHKLGDCLGMSIDFTLSQNDTIIDDKLSYEWEKNTEKGRVRGVKYFEDPDTKEKSRLLVPRFVVGVSKKDFEDLAKGFLNDNDTILDSHPFKYLMLEQIKTQIDTALDFYGLEKNKDNKSLNYARAKYASALTIVNNMLHEIHSDETINNEKYIKYREKNIPLQVMSNFPFTNYGKNKKSLKPVKHNYSK